MKIIPTYMYFNCIYVVVPVVFDSHKSHCCCLYQHQPWGPRGEYWYMS